MIKQGTGDTTGETHQGGAGQSDRWENTGSKTRQDKTENQAVKIKQETEIIIKEQEYTIQTGKLNINHPWKIQ